MKKSKTSWLQRIILVLLIFNLCAVSGIIVYLYQEHLNSSTVQAENDMRYTLYIGTNDKDTYTQLIPLEQAKQIVNQICTKYVDGYTVQEANGGWVDEKQILTQEETLIYSFVGVNEQTLQSIMDEVLIALNQNSILVETYDITYTYYPGNKEDVS